MNTLSPRENDVIHSLLQGKSNKQIARELGISERTVEFHLKNIFEKMGVNSRVELILKLGKSTGENTAKPVEPTIAGGEGTGYSGRKTDAFYHLEQSLDGKASEKEGSAMREKLVFILPVLVVLMGIVLIVAGIITRKYGAIVVGISVSAAAAYFWMSRFGKKKDLS